MRIGLLAMIALLALSCRGFCQVIPSQVNVRNYGATGDGVTDDTAAFTAALGSFGGKAGTVFVPVGQYLIKTHITIPACVALEGVWKIPTAFSQNDGSTLLAVEGAGSEEGTPFITLGRNSTLKGMTVFYPDQRPEKIVPYPWCVACDGGDNPSIVDCMLVNPYQGVDFGTRNSGRHYIRGLYGQPLRRGIFVDKCWDIGRIENVHFWPFWNWDEKSGIREWLWKNGEAFIFAKTDWEYVFNTFTFGYGIGYRFIASKEGAMNGNLLGLGADACEIAVLVEQTQAPGLLFTNGQFVSWTGDKPTEVVVKDTHTGVVQFQNCSYWGPAHQIARIEGTGTVSFNGCNFVNWSCKQPGIPAIELLGGNLLVNGCNFRDTGKQIVLNGKAESAVVVGNRMAGELSVVNNTKADLQLGLNTSGKPEAKPVEEKGAIVVDDASGAPGVKFFGDWKSTPTPTPGNYLQSTHYALDEGPKSTAVFTPNVPKAGGYTVYAWFGPDPIKDHASNAPVTIRSASGARTARVDIRKTKGEWVKLGVFKFAVGSTGSVSFSNDADGNVLADAIKLVPVGSK